MKTNDDRVSVMNQWDAAGGVYHWLVLYDAPRSRALTEVVRITSSPQPEKMETASSEAYAIRKGFVLALDIVSK